ncbi:hypothetical protein PFISCL1PPCAC_16720, partial [Pristionchus fissidentatus]
AISNLSTKWQTNTNFHSLLSSFHENFGSCRETSIRTTSRLSSYLFSSSSTISALHEASGLRPTVLLSSVDLGNLLRQTSRETVSTE